MSLVVPPNFQHILRVLNTNIDGKTSVMFALTSIKVKILKISTSLFNFLIIQGIGRRYANLCLKKADIPLTRRAGELNEEEVEKLVTIMQVDTKDNLQDFNCCFLSEPSSIQDPRLVLEQTA